MGSRHGTPSASHGSEGSVEALVAGALAPHRKPRARVDARVLAAHVARVVDAAPDLTPAQSDRLAGLLRPQR